MLDDITKRSVSEKLDAFCDRRVPPRIRDKLQLKYTFRGRSITLSEHRPSFLDADNWTISPVAQFRLAPDSSTWTLYWRDCNGRWHLYDRAAPTTELDNLIAEVDRDPTGIFWG